jgi:predicted acetyltransferase
VTEFAEIARLMWPTPVVRESYLAGELSHCLLEGWPTDWLGSAGADFDQFVARQRGTQTRWGVPSTMFWYVSGAYYIGTLMVRHELTPELAEVGGHIGYHVVPSRRQRGHATRMLAAGLAECHRLGLKRVLLTVSPGNEASHRVILANGGIPDGQARGENRFWITLGETADNP